MTTPDLLQAEARRLRRRHVATVQGLPSARDQARYLQKLPVSVQAEVLAELDPRQLAAVKAELRRRPR